MAHATKVPAWDADFIMRLGTPRWRCSLRNSGPSKTTTNALYAGDIEEGYEPPGGGKILSELETDIAAFFSTVEDIKVRSLLCDCGGRQIVLPTLRPWRSSRCSACFVTVEVDKVRCLLCDRGGHQGALPTL